MSSQTNILVNIIGEFQKKGFQDADKASKNLEKSFKKLGKTLLGVFAAKKILEFGKASVKAFAEEDRAIKQLSVSLNNLGLGYKGANVEQFISQTQMASAVSDDQLRPALQRLANATLDYGKAQSLLGLALDISASTGKSLEQVTTGLTRAYLKDTTALAKLNVGLTQAELKTMSFDEAQKILTDRFAGASSAAADSYQGKLNSLTIAADEAKEVIGKELVGALQKLAEGDFDKVIGAIGAAANGVGKAINEMAYAVASFKLIWQRVTDFGGNISMEEAEAQAVALRREFGKLPKIQVPGKPAGITQRIKQQEALNKKLNQDRAKAIALDKKAATDRLKQIKEEAALKRAGTVFDMENIQIVAALQGKVSEDQRLRLNALLAINNKNAEAAEKLSMAVLATNAAAFASIGVIIQAGDNVDDVIRKLISAQTNLALVKKGLIEIPKAKNPFEDWSDVMAGILAQIKKITDAVKAIPSIAPGTATSQTTAQAASELAAAAIAAQGTVQGRDSGVIFSPSGTPFIVPKDVTAAAFDDPRMFNPDFSNVAANPQLNWQAVGDTFVTNVNVSGSVISEGDLADVIADELYKAQRAGKSILVSSVAI